MKNKDENVLDLLHEAPNIEISIDPETNILHCNWKGLQTEAELRRAGQRINELFIMHKCSLILNDNREVRGPWHHSAEWAGSEWFPLMIESGLKHFAWICPEDFISYVSARKAVSAEILARQDVVKAFQDYNEGLQWLESKLE